MMLAQKYIGSKLLACCTVLFLFACSKEQNSQTAEQIPPEPAPESQTIISTPSSSQTDETTQEINNTPVSNNTSSSPEPTGATPTETSSNDSPANQSSTTQVSSDETSIISTTAISPSINDTTQAPEQTSEQEAEQAAIVLAQNDAAPENKEINNQTSAAKKTKPIVIAKNSGNVGGQVKSNGGVEAGVWVIAETSEFDTFFARIVVTDEAGRFVIPDLPDANYQVWVRAYGLLDSDKKTIKPGNTVNLNVTLAENDADAAKVYPAAYWYAMMNLPTEEELENIEGGLNNYLTWMKNMGCVGCHQLGQLSTRTFPFGLGQNKNHHDAWLQRISSGQAGQNMVGLVNRLESVPLKYLANWTERIAAGELPFAQPTRPAGLERNVVITVRDWSNPKAYMHDLSGTDRRNPSINAKGPLYGAPELSTDEFPILDPVNNTASYFRAPVRDADTPGTVETAPMSSSPYWGDEHIWDSKANAHNPMLDQDGRVWYTARIRAADNPDFCKKRSDHPSAKLFPLERSGRQLSIYDPKTQKYSFVDTCYSTHHLQFASDANNTLWTSGGGPVIGWLNTKQYLETGDAAASQGWSPLILDTNANGKVDDWTEPGRRLSSRKDARVNANFYAVMPNLKDGSIWGSNAFGYPGAIVRYDPKTGLGEKYNVPLPGFGSRGADIDKNGTVWVSLASGHLGEFNRDKCNGPLNGPDATGDHCPEGWTFHRLPGPGFKQIPEQSVESSYYTWVDQHNTLGLGENVPIVTGNLFDGVHALVDTGTGEKKFITLRVPYPMGFYTKGFEGRIDDLSLSKSDAWKGRGLWIPSGDRTPWLKEDGKGSRPLVVQLQMRPDPLAH